MLKIDINYNKGLPLILKLIIKVFPEASKQLHSWDKLLKNASDVVLGEKGLYSAKHKRFYSLGGSIYALYPGINLSKAVIFITAFQTIGNYLDSLCIKPGILDEKCFRQLYSAMLDAVDINREPNDYYKFFPYKHDSNYLQTLVDKCRLQISGLPSYDMVKNTIKKYVSFYSDLQIFKHLPADIREDKLASWAKNYCSEYPDLNYWEFSAAASSTLCIFALFAAASDPDLSSEEAESIRNIYFPYICSLHILLDYFIDSQRNLQAGDLNFTWYYKNLKQWEERLLYFLQKSLESCSAVHYPEFHKTIIKGIIAMYLSDSKASHGLNKIASSEILKNSDKDTRLYYNMCKILRSISKI